MKKKISILCLLTIASFLIAAAPVKAETLPASATYVHFTDEQVKLAQLNWNAYVEMTKASTPELARAFAGQITTVNPDSVIGKAALVHHFSASCPYVTTTMSNPYYASTAFTNNPYFDYYPYLYYCSYQYR